MKTVLRAVLTTLALTYVVGVGAVAAASPEPTVGGTLSAERSNIHVYSDGNVPARVTMTAESVTLSQTTFDIQPGETVDLTFTGKAVGYVSATYIAEVGGQELGSTTLSLNLAPYVPPFDWGPIFWLALIALAVVFVTWRAVRWGRRHIRIVNPEVSP